MSTFALLGYANCQITGLSASADFLHLLNTLSQREGGERLFQWKILSPDGRDLATPAGLRLAVDGDWSLAREADVIVVSAMDYRRMGPFIAAVEALRADLAWLSECWAGGARIAAACTGTFLLAECGLLNRRRATTTWWLRAQFRERYPKVRLQADALVTQDDNIYCAGPYSARENLLLQLVEPEIGRERTTLAAKLMLLDLNRSSQAPYAMLQQYHGHGDPLVSRAQEWMQARLGEPQTLDALAASLGSSVRTLIRRFTAACGQTPGGYLQRLRVDAAKRLLETTSRSVEQIAPMVGYQDVSAFRKLFRRVTGLTPREYRQRFGAGAAH
ncbi:MAG: helix-turn-helix domain-containing protein [Ectothiorhodospiraceae bacterium]|nr:helix-turn-helix domain-containing protein [Ectothiorhodospiraceae bacterium]